jgi:hypothetical protein
MISKEGNNVLTYLTETRGLTSSTLSKYGVGMGEFPFRAEDKNGNLEVFVRKTSLLPSRPPVLPSFVHVSACCKFVEWW